MRCEIHRGEDALKKLLPQLEKLNAASAAANPFIGIASINAWWPLHKTKREPVCMVIFDTDEPVLFWPFVTVPTIGGSGLWPMAYHNIDFIEPLGNWRREDIQDALNDGIRVLLKHYVFMWLPLIKPDFDKQVIAHYTDSGKWPVLRRQASVRHTFNLQGQGSDILEAKFGSTTRKTLRYTWKKLNEEGEARIQILNTADEVATMLPIINRLETQSWKSDEGKHLFALPGVRPYYEAWLPKLADEGLLRLSILECGGQAIAYEIGFKMGDTYGLHHMAYDETYEKFSPGRHLMLHNIEWAAKKGFKTYDFMQGAQQYKAELSDTTERLEEISLYARSLKGRINHRIIAWAQASRNKKVAPGL